MNLKVVRSLLPIIIIAVAVVITVVLVAAKKPPEKKQEVDKAFLVNVTPVEIKDLDFSVASQGTVMPKVQTAISAQVSGKIVNVSPAFIEGGMFKQGDILIQLEQADYVTDRKLAEAELARAQALLEEEEARGKVAEEDWRTVKNGVPTSLGLRKPQLAKEKANVRAAEAQLERAQRNLERTTIRAPYDGLVKSKSVDLGQYIGVGRELGIIYATDIAEVRMPLSDNDLAYLDMPADSSAAERPSVLLRAKVAGKSQQWIAKLARSEGVVDRTSRVIYAVAEIHDPYARQASASHMPLKFGRFVSADISGVHAVNMVVVPRNVLRMDGTVILVSEDRKLDIREVQVQRTDDEYAYISGGLRAGEMVATSAIPHPVSGMAVRLPTDKLPIKDDEEPVTAIASNGDQ
ncbi:efflux RND transporter periplasmic adaptor subunit [Alteromonadaceae bacterium BrNp21-10]|nr:efflux RND transporter periplasmic adaptor subunit [Alteromonadaceae bacterium BrNp21-10]